MSEYGVILIVITTPENTKRSIEFDEEQATLFFSPLLVHFFQDLLMAEAVSWCWKQGLKGHHFNLLFKISLHVRTEILLFKKEKK